MKTLSLFTIPSLMLLSFQVAQATDYTWDNGEPDSNVWGDAANWNPDGVPTTNADTAGFFGGSNLAINLVAGNYTINKYTDGFGGEGFEHTIYASEGGSLTIDINSSTNTDGIVNATGNAGGTLRFNNIDLTIQNSSGGNTLTYFKNNNSAGNIMLFDTTSNLTVNTLVQIEQAVGGEYQLNGTLAPSLAAIRITSSNVSIGTGHDSSAFGQSFVFLGSSKIAVNGGTVLNSGQKFQVNTSNAELELNAANSINGAFVSIAGSNSFLLDVNADQENMGHIVLPGGGQLSIDVDPAVTNLNFNSCYFQNWATGTVSITGFKEDTIRFGLNGAGLTREQLAAINGGIYSLTPDGYLTEEVIDYWARFEIDAEGFVSLSPWIDQVAYVAAPFILMEDAGLFYVEEVVGVRGFGWVYAYELDALGLTLIDGTDYGYSSTLGHWVYIPFDIVDETASWLYVY